MSEETNMSKYLMMDDWCSDNRLQVTIRITEFMMEGLAPEAPFRVICALVDGYLVITAISVEDTNTIVDRAFAGAPEDDIPDLEKDGDGTLFAIPMAAMNAHVSHGASLPSIGTSSFFSSKLGDDIKIAGSITHVDPTQDLINSLSLN